MFHKILVKLCIFDSSNAQMDSPLNGFLLLIVVGNEHSYLIFSTWACERWKTMTVNCRLCISSCLTKDLNCSSTALGKREYLVIIRDNFY